MSGVFRNIDPHPLTARRVCTPPPLERGGGHTRWVQRGWGSIIGKTPDTALYSPYVSTLCGHLMSSLDLALSGSKLPTSTAGTFL
jgi:hypothetical protein